MLDVGSFAEHDHALYGHIVEVMTSIATSIPTRSCITALEPRDAVINIYLLTVTL